MKYLLLLSALCIQAQNGPPVYEAASIKVSTAPNNNSSTNGSKGQIVFTNVTLHRLIERAWGVKPIQVSGPGWLDDVRFDIAAKYPPDTKSDDRWLMLRALLQERLKLAVHTETRDLPGYALVVAKGGFKLRPVDPADGSDTNHNGGRIHTLVAKRTPLSTLAEVLTRSLGELVVDRTGLNAVYDFDLRWSQDEQTDGPDGAPSIFSALQETLGVKLQAQKIPMEVVVVDRAERLPVEN